MKNAVSQQGESGAAAQAWAAKLNDAEAALVGLEQELEKTQDAAKGFDQSLAKAEDNAKLLDSEMRKLQAEYQGNTESVEYLTKENELLDRELVNQELAIDTLREKLDDARAKYGENSHEVKALKTEINDAEAAHELENPAADADERQCAKDAHGNFRETFGLHDAPPLCEVEDLGLGAHVLEQDADITLAPDARDLGIRVV